MCLGIERDGIALALQSSQPITELPCQKFQEDEARKGSEGVSGGCLPSAPGSCTQNPKEPERGEPGSLIRGVTGLDE